MNSIVCKSHRSVESHNRRVMIVKSYLGFINGRCIFKLSNVGGYEDTHDSHYASHDQCQHDIMTNRILHVDVIGRTLSTENTLYVVDSDSHNGDIVTTQQLIDIYNEIIFYREFGCNNMRWIRREELEKPNETMVNRFR